MVGKTLGHYEILEPLGAGGMGEVYRARDTKLDRDVAIKVLPDDFAADADRLARFKREAKLLAAINHPNIAAIYSLEAEGSRPFLVLELVEGQTLQRELDKGALPVDRALTFAHQITQALGAAHEQGIVHRDLKPANVLITRDGDRAKVLDFGVAKTLTPAEGADKTAAATDLTTTGTLVGTAPYMSPEQIRGEAIDKRADIWAFGCLLFELLTGESPFGRETVADTLASIIGQEPRWDDLPADTPERVRAMLQRCLQKDRTRRYSDVWDAQVEIEESAKHLVGSFAGAPALGTGPVPRTPAREPRRGAAALGGRALVVAGLFAVLLGGLYFAGILPGFTDTATVAPIRSIAVLPFENLSGDTEQEYFVVGMADLLTTNLGRIGSLQVIGRQSAMQLGDSTDTPVQIAALLGVDALILGSVFRAGDEVRVNVQLLDGNTGAQIWGASYTGDASETFAMQGATARAIADEISVTLTPAEAELLASVPAVSDRQALEDYALGRYELETWTEEGVGRSIGYFNRALSRDPEFALAHAGLAEAYAQSAFSGYMPGHEAVPKAREAAQRAMDIDPTLGAAQVALAHVTFRTGRDWEGLEELFLNGVELNPNDTNALHRYSHFLMSTLRTGEAIEVAEAARRLDPLSAVPSMHLGVTYRWARRFEDAVQQQLETRRLFPDYHRARAALGGAYLANGQVEAAIREFDELYKTFPDLGNRSNLAFAKAMAGDAAPARELLAELLDREVPPPFMIADLYQGLGEIESAFEWYGKAIDASEGPLEELLVDPGYDVMRADPGRWEDLLRKAGFREDLIVARRSGTTLGRQPAK